MWQKNLEGKVGRWKAGGERLEPDSELGFQQNLQDWSRSAPGDEAGTFIVRIVVGSRHQANLIFWDTVKEDELTNFALQTTYTLCCVNYISIGFSLSQLLVLPHVAPGIRTPAHLPHKPCCSVTCSMSSHSAHASKAGVLLWWWVKLFPYTIDKGSGMNDKILHSVIEANHWTGFPDSITASSHKGLEKLNQLNN